MKKLLAILAICLLLPGVAWGASYYGCNACTDPTSNTCWTTNPDTTCATCSGTYETWANVNVNGSSLHLNGCAMAYNLSTAALTIPASGTLTLLSNKVGADAESVAGGQLTLTTNASNVATVAATTIETGGTTGAVLKIAGSADGAARVTLTAANINGGTAATMPGVLDEHTVGGVVVNATNITGGSNNTAYGYYWNSSTGDLIVNGNANGGSALVCFGLYSNVTSGTTTINGDCIASAGGYDSVGCRCVAATGYLNVTGSMIGSTETVGATGNIRWTPSSAQKYVSFDGGGTAIYAGAGLGSDAGGTQITGANTAAQVATGTYFIKKDDHVYTQGSKAGGGGAWAN